MYLLIAALEIQEHLLTRMQITFKQKMLRFRYEKRWEISLAVYNMFLRADLAQVPFHPKEKSSLS